MKRQSLLDITIVDLRINETLQTGAVSNCADAVGNRIYRGVKVSIYF